MIVLAYHQVDDRLDYSWNTVSSAALARQMAIVRDEGYTGVPFCELPARATGDGRRMLAVTFDDAMRGAVRSAVPVLSQYGFRGTFFVPTAWIGERNAWDSRLVGRRATHAAWDDLRYARDHGWEIGAHGHSHRDLTTLDDEALANEMQAPITAIESALDVRVTTIAYPFGRVDERVAAAARRAGYVRGAITTKSPGTGEPADPMRCGRLCVRRFDLDVEFRAKIRGGALHRWQIAKDRIAYFCNAGTPALWQRWSRIR